MGQVIEMNPQPPCINVSRADWAATPSAVRSDIIRAWQELSAGIAIAKDKRCGRSKPHRQKPPAAVSFYALHLLEMEIWRRPDISAPYEMKAEALREKLAPDIERMAQNDALEPFHKMAERSGTTLAEALRKYTASERRLRADPVNEIARILMNLGVDPEEWARRTLAGDDGSIPDEAA